MENQQILITGASGCVGQYTTDWLVKNSKANLILLIRDPKKLTAINTENPRIKLLIGDLREVDKFANELSSVTHVIHTATAWGDPVRANQVNIIAVKRLLELLNPDRIKTIIYFSTASILNKNLEPLKDALSAETEYIQTKAKCFKSLEAHPLAKKIIAVFPTLVFGGEFNPKDLFPKSYLTEGLREAIKWIWLARWFKAYSRFHFIHAADIAFICGQLVSDKKFPHLFSEADLVKKLVLGQPAISIDQAIEVLLKWRGMRKTPSFPLWDWIIEILIKILPMKLSKWDRISIKRRHFVHEPITSPESFGGTSYARTLNEIIFYSRLPRTKN